MKQPIEELIAYHDSLGRRIATQQLLQPVEVLHGPAPRGRGSLLRCGASPQQVPQLLLSFLQAIYLGKEFGDPGGQSTVLCKMGKIMSDGMAWHTVIWSNPDLGGPYIDTIVHLTYRFS